MITNFVDMCMQCQIYILPRKPDERGEKKCLGTFTNKEGKGYKLGIMIFLQ